MPCKKQSLDLRCRVRNVKRPPFKGTLKYILFVLVANFASRDPLDVLFYRTPYKARKFSKVGRNRSELNGQHGQNYTLTFRASIRGIA